MKISIRVMAMSMVAMALLLGLVIRFQAAAQETDLDDYFARHVGPVSGQTDIDPYDPYAPVDLEAGTTLERTAIRYGVPATSPLRVISAQGAKSEHCMPTTCKAW